MTEEQIDKCTDFLRKNYVHTEKLAWSELVDIAKAMEEYAEDKKTKENISLKKEAEECLDALSYWEDNEFDFAPGHKAGNMRPMVITKSLLQKSQSDLSL